MGCVMGSKNLKAIACKGTHPTTFADPELFMKLAWELREKIHNSASAKRRRIEGSQDLFDVGNAIGINAHKNWSTGYMKGLEEDYNGVTWNEKYLFRRKACWSCPVACGRYTLIKEGKYAGFNAGGPEMESLCNLGPRIDSRNLDGGVNVLCGLVNDLGMDSVSGGAALSWTMEAFDKGYLNTTITGGIKPEWGDIEASITLLNQIARRENKFARILGEGNLRAAYEIGAGMDIVPHCRGLEHISVDPRVALGFGLGYAMSTRGSDHLKNYSCLEFAGCAKDRAYQLEEIFTPDMLKKFWLNFPAEMYEMDTKPQLCTWSEKNKCVSDLVSCCCQAIGSWGGAGDWKEAYVPMFRAATGLTDISDAEIFKVAERVIAIERAHWLRDGSGKQDDNHTDFFFEVGVSEGPHKGRKLDRKQWAWAQQEYYRLHGWDSDGFITAEKAKELDLPEIIPDMVSGKALYKKYVDRGPILYTKYVADRGATVTK
jgi:aldehyde:ferredoxin oxidoreductase